VLHQVGVSFDLYYDALKHKIKTLQQYYSSVFFNQETQNAKHVVSQLRIEFVVISSFPVFSPHDERVYNRTKTSNMRYKAK